MIMIWWVISSVRHNFFSAQYPDKQIKRISPNFEYAMILVRSRLGLLYVIFHPFRVMAHDWCQNFVQNFVYGQYLEIKMIEFHQILYFQIDKIYVMIVTHHFSHICTRVMVPWFKPKFLSAQYFENKLTEFYKFYICTHIDIDKIYYTSFFAHLYQSYGHWFTQEICFFSISVEHIDRISPNFLYSIHIDKI